MRNITLLDNVNAGVQNISVPINLEKRTDWNLIIETNGLNSLIEVFIEQGYSAGKSSTPTNWVVLQNCCYYNGAFPVEDDIVQIEKSVFTANWFRVRVESLNNISGTITAKLHYKDYP
tara:strand:- start:469 stop:822 length:354 start_codon:yes stop_codon:yes gene_type:complete